MLHTRSDAEMADYYWDASQYPACIHAEPEPPAEELPPEEGSGSLPVDPEEHLPEEETPQEPSGEEPEPETPAPEETTEESLPQNSR